MPTRYKYRAFAPDGQTEEGFLSAENDRQVFDYLAERRLSPIEVSPAKDSGELGLLGFFQRTQYEDIIMFTRSLSSLYKAGVPLLRALTVIRVGPANGRFNHVISELRNSLQSGKPLSVSMAEFPAVFPRVYTASVAAGEESGKLDELLDSLGVMLEEELELNRQIKSGTRYPLMVVTALAAAMVVMLTYVVPKFVAFYQAFDAELPIYTRLLIGTSNFITSNWILILAGLGVATVVAVKASANERVRNYLDGLWLKIPIFGDVIIKGNVARFTMMFGILTHAGIPIVKSLGVLTESIRNTKIAGEVGQIKDMLEEGRDNQITTAGLRTIPDMALQMISIGLESGSLERMLREISVHYAKEVRYTTKNLTALLEPILTLVMGVFVLILALSIFLPMWNLIKVFHGS